jgi:hypothetical protein
MKNKFEEWFEENQQYLSKDDKETAGQPRKRGFYSKCFRNAEQDDLPQVDAISLQQEIEMLRVIARRAAEMAEIQVQPKVMLQFYRVVGEISSHISVLMRAQKLLHGKDDPREIIMGLIESSTSFLKEKEAKKLKQSQSVGTATEHSDETGGYKPILLHSPVSPESDVRDENEDFDNYS